MPRTDNPGLRRGLETEEDKMAWITKKEPDHRCDLPQQIFVNLWGTGSVWECDDCGQRWQWVEDDWVVRPGQTRLSEGGAE